MSKASDDVLAERQRQIGAEGFDAAHDDGHDDDRALARASFCYLGHYVRRQWVFGHDPENYKAEEPPDEWPWDFEWWKPKDPRRDLVRAAALLLAQIEQMDRN